MLTKHGIVEVGEPDLVDLMKIANGEIIAKHDEIFLLNKFRDNKRLKNNDSVESSLEDTDRVKPDGRKRRSTILKKDAHVIQTKNSVKGKLERRQSKLPVKKKSTIIKFDTMEMFDKK